ncbi:MAG: hypothetical protein IJ154_01500 [Bacteroidales bacterium]|nr:hypothetical protein [Bacteroidales bacterium]
MKLTKMKPTLLLALCCCLFLSCRQQAASILFESGDDFESLKSLAAEKRRPLMLFVWKNDNRMTRIVREEVLGDAQVAGFFNEHFVNVQIHIGDRRWRWMEQQYGLCAYPLMLVVDDRGRLIAEFSSLGRLGLTEEGELPCRRPLLRQAGLYSRFSAENDSVFFREENWKVMDGCHIRLDSELFHRILRNKELLRSRYGQNYDVLVDYNLSATAVSLFLPDRGNTPRRNNYRIRTYYQTLDSFDIDRRERYRFYADVNLAAGEGRYQDVFSLAKAALDQGYIQEIEYEDLMANFQ